MIPIILLAFANDKRSTGAGYLRGLTTERNAIRDALMKAEENGLCEVLVEPDVTVDRIFDIFQNSNYRDRIAIFHYGGHAESYSLLLETESGDKATAHSDGLVGFLSKQKSLKLVFLNGCSSENQSKELVKAGLPAVIGTSQAIQDTIATSLATRFYKGLSSGMAIERAWTDSIDQVKTETGKENTKALFQAEILGAPGLPTFPWDLYLGEGGVLSKTWNLPEAANQPLFGLELPISYYRKLPLAPYVGNRSFSKEEAAIFYGRGPDIRKLHNQLESEQPLILLSGKKGVGKTSLLATGLAPRLESEYTVAYCHLENKSITESITDALDQIRQSSGLEKLAPKDKNNLEVKIAEVKSSVLSTSGFAKEILENELNHLVHLSRMDQLTFFDQWIAIEEKTGLPLVIISDELPSNQEEWKPFLEMMVSTFDVIKPPRGKLVLSVDEENHQSFCEFLQSARFPYAEEFLQPLTWEGLNEAVTGVTHSPITKEFYRLQIETSSSYNLPETLSGDLLDGETTLVAPYLQVILSHLWQSAIKENAQTPVITLKNYQQGILSGEIMDKFLMNQLALLRIWKKEHINSGLALDLLHLHVSALGKSNILDAVKREQTYGDRKEIVNTLVKKCKDLFLLTGAHSNGTNLGHNLLAQVVIRQYSISLSPGQQAARILNGKTGDTAEPGKTTWLNEADLAVVENGLQGMRSLTQDEKTLIEFSRVKKSKAQKERKRNKIIRGVLTGVIVIFAALAAWQWRLAYLRYLYSRSSELAFKASEAMMEDNTLALDIARRAYSMLDSKSPPLVMQTLSDIFHSQDEMPFYISNFPHTKRVLTAVFSPDGKYVLTASEDGTAKLWDLKGQEILSLPHEIEVGMAAFSPNGQQILTMTRNNIFLWEKDGTLTDKDSITEDVTDLSLFSTNGMKIIPNYVTEDSNKYFLIVNKLREQNQIVVPSPTENRVISLQYGSCTLCDGNGEVFKDSISSSVIHASFSHDGKYFLTVTSDPDSCKIIVWNEVGDSLYSFRSKGSQVNAVFSPDGHSILTASNDFTAKLWDFSHPFLHRFPKQSGAMNSIDYFPEGETYLTASYDSTAKIWDASGMMIDSLKHGDVVTSAIFAKDGNLILTASRDRTARLWRPKENSVTVLQHNNEVTHADFSHDGQWVISSSMDSLVRLWNLEGKEVHIFPHNAEVTWVTFSPDDSRLLSVSSNDDVTLWNIQGDSLHVFRHPAKVYTATFSLDGMSFLTTCADSIVRLWDVSGGIIKTYQHFEKPKFAFFTADGEHMITGGKMVKIWNADGILQDSLLHTENVSSVTVSDDGQMILTTCIDQNAYLWDFSGQLLSRYRGHTEKINSGFFTPDGKNVFTVSDDGYVMRWKTPQSIYSNFKTSPIYHMSKKEEQTFGLQRRFNKW